MRLHGQSLTIFASHPASYFKNIYTGFNTTGGEKVTQILLGYVVFLVGFVFPKVNTAASML